MGKGSDNIDLKNRMKDTKQKEISIPKPWEAKDVGFESDLLNKCTDQPKTKTLFVLEREKCEKFLTRNFNESRETTQNQETSQHYT